MKKKKEKFDGLSTEDIRKIRAALRKVWHWSYPRKLVVKRCTGEDGFFRCELCAQITPKLNIDHIVEVGQVNGGFIERLFTPSKNLRGLCLVCHRERTNTSRAKAKWGF